MNATIIGIITIIVASWYECDYYRNYYDNWHKDGFKEFCDWAKKEQYKDCFKVEYPAEDVLKMCLYEGKPYMTTDFLNTGKAFSISQQDKKEISDMMRDYAAAVPGAVADKSVLSMRERTADGKLLPENKAVNAAVIAKAMQAGR